MGVNLKDIVVKKETSLADLKNRKLVVDGNNVLYQFLSTIRQPDGTPLMDSKGEVTSHLNGLFHRTTRLMHYGMRLVFVFDGKAPDLKYAERERRAGIKKEAERLYEEAKKEGDTEGMKKYSMRTSRLSPEMVREAVELIRALGLPVVMAPSEGEAQAALMVKKGDVFAEISQDYDCLLFGVPRMVQNLTISERKKKKDRLSYETVKPQLIELEPNLKNLGLTQDQLIVLGILVGTDYNVGGIKGIGPKKAIEMVKRRGQDFDALFRDMKWDDHFSYSWKDVFRLFKEMPVNDDYVLDWKALDRDKVVQVLCGKHDFSRERVDDALDKLEAEQSRISQKGLGEFF
ncbi:flap endonuclease-1 [Candidatus Woesearchaeota archaeon]|nr:flap endonuclease-1 [Candidatus Woesearchaeota archaeon]